MQYGLSFFLAVTCWAVGGAPARDGPVPLPCAHAHNDYWHARPLFDALAHGFCNVEADVFLVDSQLLVGHDRSNLTPVRTLETLYLKPLRARIVANEGHVYPHGPPFTLMIDIKSNARETYRVLSRLLARYADILTRIDAARVTPGPVTIVVSGNRATGLIASEPTRFAMVDGRLSDLDKDQPASLISWISDRWTSHFRWRGNGPMPDAQRDKLRSIVAKAHRAGQRVRFWATPDRPTVWRELDAAGVDLINADDLSGLQSFLLRQRAKTEGLSLQYDGEDRLAEVLIDAAPARIHTQGLYVTSRHYYVTGRLEAEPNRPLLIRFDRQRADQVESIDLVASLRAKTPQVDGLDHPGGFDFDGRRFWIPIAASHPDGRTFVVTYRPVAERSLSSQPVTVAFAVDDHIGAIAYDRSTNRLYGANWDTRFVYAWKPDGTRIRKIRTDELLAENPARGLAVQDWKSFGAGLILASGIDKSPTRRVEASRAMLAEIAIPDGSCHAYQRLPAPPGHHIEPTREGMAVFHGSIYLLPGDLGRGATIYRYRWNRNVDGGE